MEAYKDRKIEQFKKEHPECVLNLLEKKEEPVISIKHVDTNYSSVCPQNGEIKHLEKTVGFHPDQNMIESIIPIPRNLLREDIKELVINHKIYI